MSYRNSPKVKLFDGSASYTSTFQNKWECWPRLVVLEALSGAFTPQGLALGVVEEIYYAGGFAAVRYSGAEHPYYAWCIENIGKPAGWQGGACTTSAAAARPRIAHSLLGRLRGARRPVGGHWAVRDQQAAGAQGGPQ